MSLAVSRRCLTAGGLTLALVLSSPLSALADPDRGTGQHPHSSARSPQAASQPSSTPSAAARPASPSEQRTRPRRDSGKGERGTDERRAPARRAASADTPQAGPSGSEDPRGNNGTIKVDGVAFDDSKGNEPHVGCDVRLVFWGFDAGDTASITFTGQAPTGGGLLHSESGTLISRDAAGGGQDLDEALVFSLDGALSELTSIAPHPQQGWHVKVAVDVDSAPGGAKQKVFWMSCPTVGAAGAAAPTTVSAAGVSGTTVSAPTRGTQRGASSSAVPELTLGSSTLEVSEQGAVTTGAVTSAAVTTAAGAAAGVARDAGGASASARAADRPSALPFTGPAALGLLAALGLGSLAAGGVAHRLGRRREVLATA